MVLESAGMIEEAFNIFGKQSFQHAIFYSNDECLRFELSEGDSRTKMFMSALCKATEVIDIAFASSDNISICLAFPGNSYMSNLNVFRELKKLEIVIPKENFRLREWIEDDEWNRNYLFFSIGKSQLHKFLFGKLAAELGVAPSFWFDLYIFDTKLGLLANPYDDRGMDITGPNKSMLKRLYNDCNGQLLDYDMKKMRDWFGAI
jgi:hypothetical protein